MTASFAIRRRDTGRFFIGFGPAPAFETMYGREDQAKQFASRSDAETQAILLRRFADPVQIRPVVFGGDK